MPLAEELTFGSSISCWAEANPNAIRDFLSHFVAEDGNPHNRIGVTKVELFYAAPILSSGTVLTDTPGIASTLKHNTEAALRVLPECDGALFVVATDLPSPRPSSIISTSSNRR